MFSRFVALLPLAALAAVVAAHPSETCNSGSVYCCNQKFSNPSKFEDYLGLVDVILGLDANAGVECSPITVIGALSDGGKCTQQTACCEDVHQDGLVNVECSPIAALV